MYVHTVFTFCSNSEEHVFEGQRFKWWYEVDEVALFAPPSSICGSTWGTSLRRCSSDKLEEEDEEEDEAEEEEEGGHTVLVCLGCTLNG